MAPWAWLGLGTLVLPVLVHLLARDRAPFRRLPTLRFLEATPPAAVRRTRLRDPFLLLLRLLVLLLAVAAFARPHLPAGSPALSSGAAAPLTRVILVDASPGMVRLTPNGATALEEARARARDMAAAGGDAGAGPERANPDSANPDRGNPDRGNPDRGMGTDPLFHGAAGPARPGATYVVEVDGGGDALVRAMVGAGAFLGGLAGRREVVVLSTFQVGTLPGAEAFSDGTMHLLPGEGIGIRLEAIAVDSISAPDRVIRHPSSETRVSIQAFGEGIRVRWVREPLAGGSIATSPTRLGSGPLPDPLPDPLLDPLLDPDPGPGPEFSLDSIFWGRLAEGAGLPVSSAEHPVEVRLRPAETEGDPQGGPFPDGRPWSEAPGWMADVALAVARDPVLEAAAVAHPAPGAGHEPATTSLLPLVHRRTGEPVVVAAPVGTGVGTSGPPTLMLGVHGTSESLLAAALVAAASRASPGVGPLWAWDPRVLADADLEAWRRPSVVRPPDPDEEGEGAGQARLLWLGVLLLLGVEWGVRRRRPSGLADPAEKTEARP